jgi:multiple sugar transport system ATP-binding protein
VRGEIRAMHQRSRTTSVYVTHDQIEAMTMGDRIVVLRGGQVEQVGTPVELYEQPVNRFVAHFIGSPAMNFLEFGIDRSGGAARATVPGHAWALPEAVAGGRDRLVLGVRPEHLRVGPAAGEGDMGLVARVEAIEFTGAQSQVMLSTPGGALVACMQERPAMKPGDAVNLTLLPHTVHWFDAGTGARLPSHKGHS